METIRRTWIGLAAAVLFVWPATAGVRVSIQPDTTWARPDSVINVMVYVDSAGSSFNAYHTVIRWDPSVIEFVSVQSESLFNRHNYVLWLDGGVAGPDSVGYLHSLMEGGATETGPGALSSLTFHTLRLGISPVRFDSIEFYRFGSYVTPVYSTDGVVMVASSAEGVETSPPGRARSAVISIAPNQMTPESILSAPPTLDGDGVLRLFNARGEMLGEKIIGFSDRPPGRSVETRLARLFYADRLPTGAYWIQLSTGKGEARGHFVIIR